MEFEIRDITDDDEQEVHKIDEDILENIERSQCEGIAVYKDGKKDSRATLMWEYCGTGEDEQKRAEFLWFHMVDRAAADRLLEEFEKRTSEQEIVASVFEFQDMDKEITDFLSEKGFAISEKEGTDLMIEVGDLSELPIAKKKPPEFIVSIDELTSREFKQVLLRCLWNHHRGIYEDIINIPMYWFDTRISCCFRTDNRVSGVFLIHLLPSGALLPTLLFAEGTDARMNILYMMRYAVQMVINDFDPKTKIIIRRKTEAVRKLTEKFFPEKTGEKVVFGSRGENEGEVL